jgi:hypothetical protein
VRFLKTGLIFLASWVVALCVASVAAAIFTLAIRDQEIGIEPFADVLWISLAEALALGIFGLAFPVATVGAHLTLGATRSRSLIGYGLAGLLVGAANTALGLWFFSTPDGQQWNGPNLRLAAASWPVFATCEGVVWGLTFWLGHRVLRETQPAILPTGA